MAPSCRCSFSLIVLLLTIFSRLDLTRIHAISEINSSFIEISIHLFVDTTPGVATSELISLLPIYLDSFFSLPVTRADGTKLDYEEVVRQLNTETLSYMIDSGRPLQEDITIRMKVTKDKYSTAIAWLRDLIYGSEFSIDRSVYAVSSSR